MRGTKFNLGRQIYTRLNLSVNTASGHLYVCIILRYINKLMIYNRARLSNLSRCPCFSGEKIRSLSIHFYRAKPARKLRKDEIEETVANCNHCASVD